MGSKKNKKQQSNTLQKNKELAAFQLRTLFSKAPISKKLIDAKNLCISTFWLIMRCDASHLATPVWNWLKPILLIAFLLRCIVALSGNFVLHPDEIMQYLEPAHATAFGNGVLYWEYYYGARNWLVPSVVASVLWFCKILGLDSPLYYVAMVKILFCAFSVIVPYSMYHVNRALFNEGAARIALILGCFWYELVGFAHKPMTEFLATSLVFLLLAVVYKNNASMMTTRRAIIIAGTSVLIAAIRFHYIPIAGMIALIAFIHTNLRYRLIMIASSIIFVAFIGLFEYFTWGSFFHSYLTNIKVNLLLSQGRADESTPYLYLLFLGIASGGIFILSLISAVNIWRRGFIILLILLILIPHMLEAHREYRFIYVALPLLLMLFADVLHNGLFKFKSDITINVFKKLGLAYAAIVSLLGISNTIPFQSIVYKAHSQETGNVNFLFQQDKIFNVFNHLASDPSVKGVLENNQVYFNGGGYYHLHHSVPYYDASNIWNYFFAADKLSDYISHIVMDGGTNIEGVFKHENGTFFLKDAEKYIPLPRLIYDKQSEKIVFFAKDGSSFVNEDYELVEDFGQYTIWRRRDNTQPIRQWKDYLIYPDNAAMHGIVDKAIDNARPPNHSLGIEIQ